MANFFQKKFLSGFYPANLEIFAQGQIFGPSENCQLRRCPNYLWHLIYGCVAQ